MSAAKGLKGPKKKSGAMTYSKSEDKVRERKQVIVDRALDELYAAHGSVSTDIVLAEARDPANKLHAYFDWDDSIAGEKWRKTQAYALIMSSKFTLVLNSETPPTVIGAKQEVRRLVSAFRGEGFRVRTDALANADSRGALIAKWRERLRSWVRETADIEELDDLRRAITEHL